MNEEGLACIVPLRTASESFGFQSNILNRMDAPWWLSQLLFFDGCDFFLVGKKSYINAANTILKEFPISTNAVFSKLQFDICGFCHLNVRWMQVLKVILCKNKGSSFHKSTCDPFVSCILLTSKHSLCTCSMPGTLPGTRDGSWCRLTLMRVGSIKKLVTSDSHEEG